MTYLKGLNEAQKRAVQHSEGPLLIIAGAGAGKTKTITHRIARLIGEGGVAPEAILAVTFTNKAAKEMRERVLRLLPPNLPRTPLVTTFHSLGVRLLREFAVEAGLSPRFSIFDRDDSVRAVKHALEAIHREDLTPRQVLSRISREKGEGRAAREFRDIAETPYERAVASVWERYEKKLVEEEALDFDDLLLRTLTLLSGNAAVLERLRRRFRFITIDEYQDTNRTQFEIARLLASPLNNICAVGDTDQNIYSWRGADLGHLLSFEATFPGTTVVMLEQNYRSTKTILAAANNIIAKNARRHEKRLFTENETGSAIQVYSAADEDDEARYIARTIRELLASGVPAAEIAVLYRENFQSRAIEERLIALGIPYRIAGTRFFDRKEIKDALSWVRGALNPKSSTDLARIVSAPPRGIGKTTLDKMLKGEPLSRAAEGKVAAFRTCLGTLRSTLETQPVSAALRSLLKITGMEESLLKGGEEGLERLANVRELVSLAARYDGENPPAGAERLLEDAALMGEQDSLEEGAKAVSLMTAHASKGLEFDAVFIAGVEQGLFPSTRETDTRDPEEERRLFYVALTRARKEVYLAYAARRMRYGSREFCYPSEFLEDIDARLLALPETPPPRKRGILDWYEEDEIR